MIFARYKGFPRPLEPVLGLIPRDDLRTWRMRMLASCHRAVVLYRAGLPVSVCWVNLRFGVLPVLTWMTRPEYRRRGYASNCARKVLKSYRIAAVKVRNPASAYTAHSCGFKRVFGHYYITLRRSSNTDEGVKR